jgi:hypothetical protein
MPQLFCEICGKEIEQSQYMNADLCSSECFHKHFWNELIEIKDDPNVVRVNGEHYYIGDENAPKGAFRGFDGAEFVIKFNNGSMVTTTNLWYNGEIPEDYQKELPDNAVFIKRG